MYSKCFLDCDYQFFIDQNKADASSCIKHQVDELKDIHESYGGFPETYTMANTKIYQTWFDKTEIDFDGVEVQGELVKPQGSLLLERKHAKFNPMIKLRTDFDDLMEDSIQEIK